MTDDLVVMPPQQQAPMETQPFHRWTEPDGSEWLDFYRTEDGFLLRFPELADFHVAKDGSKAKCSLVPGNDVATQEHLYLSQVIPLMQSARGELIFHASAVECSGGAIAFIGASGRGKSTLAASFATSGNRFLTDDGLTLEKTSEGYMALPSHPSVRMWDDTALALRTDSLVMAPPVSYSEKSRALAGGGLSYCAEPRNLIATFFLGDSNVEETSFRLLHGADALKAWMSNLFLLDIQDQNRVRENFQEVADIAASVPAIALDYPRRYDDLSDLRGAILAEVNKLTGD